MMITNNEPDEVALQEEADHKTLLATCLELTDLFTSRTTKYRMDVFFEGEYLRVMDVSGSKQTDKGGNNVFKSVFGDSDPKQILDILKSDDWEPLSVLLKTSREVAKDWVYFLEYGIHPYE